MAITVLFNGITYSVPETGEESWGDSLTSYLSAIGQGCLQKTGGAFTLTANVNFGANFGLLSKTFSTRTANPSTAGLLRLAVTDTIGWRNNANSSDLLLAVNGSDQLTFNGSAIYSGGITALTGDVTATGPGSAAATIAANAITDAKVSATAAIALSKLENIATSSILGRITASTGSAEVLTATQATSLLNAVVGDSGAGGTKGLVPAPAAGDAAALKFLKADGTWQAPAGAGTVSSVAMTVPTALFSASPVAGSPITSSGTLAPTLATQSARTFFQGPDSGSAATPTFRALKIPTVQKLQSSFLGGVGWAFLLNTGTPSAGATYTNNGSTFTFLENGSNGWMVTTGVGTPQILGGTLTLSGGSGDPTLTYVAAQRYEIYTAPTNPAPLYLRVRMAGGGAGGAKGSDGLHATTAADNGMDSFFGTLLLNAQGGFGGSKAQGGSAGYGGISSPAVGTGSSGNPGNCGGSDGNPIYLAGGNGGAHPIFGSAGVGGFFPINGGSGLSLTGAGGGGGAGGGNGEAGGGGGSGGAVDAIIPSPNPTYYWATGDGGAGETAIDSGSGNGGYGGSGYIEVTEYYQ